MCPPEFFINGRPRRVAPTKASPVKWEGDRVSGGGVVYFNPSRKRYHFFSLFSLIFSLYPRGGGVVRHVERSRNIFQASPVKWEGDLPTAKTEGLYVMLSAVETSEDSSTPLRSAQNDETLVGANCVRLRASDERPYKIPHRLTKINQKRFLT